MGTFQDRNQTTWVVELNTTQLKRAKALGFDIPDGIATGNLLERCVADEIYLVDLIYVLCSKQCEERDISDEKFGELVGTGVVIQEAVRALMEALTDFYRDRAATTLKAMKKYKEMEHKATEMAGKKIDEMNIDDLVSKFGKQLTTALESAESTLVPSPSGP